MPIYSYKCETCGEVFDKLVKAGGNGKVKCKECKSDTQRVFSPVGIIFKGSGFYSTDYKSGLKSAKAADNSPSSEKKENKKQEPSKSSSKDKAASSSKEKSKK